jgi:hypothetical protein
MRGGPFRGGSNERSTGAVVVQVADDVCASSSNEPERYARVS